MRTCIGYLVLACALACTNTAAMAEWSFIESFDGGFDNAWGESPALPTVSYAASLVFIGAPDYSFETVDGAQVLRLTNQLNPASRCGLVSIHTLEGSLGEVEARVNTLVQNRQIIDGLFELWLVNPEDPGKYVSIMFHSGSYSAQRMVLCFSSEDGMYVEEIGYENNTWYLFRISATSTVLRVSIWDDTGTAMLFAHDMSHTLSTLGDSFRIAIAQHMDSPDGTYTADSAVDHVVVREDFVPVESRSWSDLKALFR